MTGPDPLLEMLRELGLSAVASPRDPDEFRCTVPPGAVTACAEALCGRLGFDLLAMAADDRRRHAGTWFLHYLLGASRRRTLVHVSVPVERDRPVVPSLAPYHLPASRFEREIHDQFGLLFDGHPDPRPLVRHAFWPADYHPLRQGEPVRDGFADDGHPFPFMPVGGEGVYEIPVGPVHAGIIEPGHFRFSVLGETIITMKSRLYFTHKGTEKLFEGREPLAAVELAERISGDTSVGHALAYAQAVESATGATLPPRAAYLRVVLLELERLYNHVADFGAIANDTGFAIAHAHCFRIRETLLRLNKDLTGSRLLRGVVIPGGLAHDLPAHVDVAGRVDEALSDFEAIADICLRNTMVLDRLDGTGVLGTSDAQTYGVLGYVARASGIDADLRRDRPFAAYDRLQVRVPVLTTGDVRARTLIRLEEARQSASLIRQAWAAMPTGAIRSTLRTAEPYQPAFGLVEGWRGRIVHVVIFDANGRLHRVKVVDPSFLNWPALSRALVDAIVPDFPLCNKSFNQSYSGHDL